MARRSEELKAARSNAMLPVGRWFRRLLWWAGRLEFNVFRVSYRINIKKHRIRLFSNIKSLPLCPFSLCIQVVAGETKYRAICMNNSRQGPARETN